MQRRTFLVGGATGVTGIALVGCRPWMKPDAAPPRSPASPHQVATIAAMAATFIPSSPGSPGASEARAAETILEPAFGVDRYVDEVVADLDDWCWVRHGGKQFVALSPSKRERALEERMGFHGRLVQSVYKPVYEGILALTKLAFYGGLSTPLGPRYVGFPGASAGYAPDGASGAYFADGPEVTVAGAGRVSAAAISLHRREAGPAHLVDPAGGRHALPAEATIDDAAVPGALGVAAAGTWKLEAAGLAYWALVLRSDHDDAVVGAVSR